MKIELKEITVKTLTEGFADNAEQGVVAYDGKLDIRPPYQREFIYKDKQRDAVIDTVRKNFPLNVMYWAVREDGQYEVIDGQQRTLSVCQYVNGDFSINSLAFHNLKNDQQQQILDYKLMVYFCDGTDSEKLEWFETINIAGEELTKQELRNAVYAGPWTADAKRYFSKPGCVASKLANNYTDLRPIRQEYLEKAIEWHALHGGATGKKDEIIKGYMSAHQKDENAIALWNYFQSVIGWVSATFKKNRKEMKSVEWGPLYNTFGTKAYNPASLEERVARLMEDDDVQKKSGIYAYVLDGDERHLSIRTFSPNMKREAYERQKGICVKCRKHFELDQMEADHIDPWSKGGKTDAANCQMLCLQDNRRKGAV